MERTAALLAAALLLCSCGGRERAGTAVPASPSAAAAATASPAAGSGCPGRFRAEGAGRAGPWVPEPPTTETPGRLVPDADPVEALVCRYDGAGALTGDVLLEDGLDRIRTDLLVPARLEGSAQRCAAPGAGRVPHLVRLRYADGELWLSAVQDPDGCATTGNGAFVSSADLGEHVARAYEAAAWPATDPDPCGGPAPGRAGQEQVLVPPGWTSLVVCGQDRGPRAVPPDRAAQVASLLGQLEPEPGPGPSQCEATTASDDRLVLGYPQGPSVVVRRAPGCRTLGNGSLSAVPTPAQAELLAVLLG